MKYFSFFLFIQKKDKDIFKTTLTFLVSTLCSRYAHDFFLSDSALYEKAKKGIGRCWIQGSCSGCFCPAYGKATVNGNHMGLPDRYGTGCLGMGCWGPPNTYQRYSNTLLPICTGNIVRDGANMIRIGIVKGFCDHPQSHDLRSSAPSNQTSNVTSQTNSLTATSASNSTSTPDSETDTSNQNVDISSLSPMQASLIQSSPSASVEGKRSFELRQILILTGFILSAVLNAILGFYIYRNRTAKIQSKQAEPQKQISDPEKQVDSSNKFQINK